MGVFGVVMMGGMEVGGRVFLVFDSEESSQQWLTWQGAKRRR